MYSYQNVTDGNGEIVVWENRDAELPNLAYSNINSVASTFWAVNGARVTLNRLTLAYALPKNFVKKLRLSNIRFNITGQNLINFYNPYPEKFMSSAWGAYGNYPVLRKWTVGINIGF